MSVRTNANSLGFYDIIKSETVDVTNIESTERFFSQKENQAYDIIVCNPPWLNAGYVFSQNDFENAVYDPNYTFLESSLKLASK